MKKKILVVDDEPHLAEMMANRLRASRYEVVTALKGHEALEKAKRENPDLILLDILMPDMDGYQVLVQLKEDGATQTIPVIMLTVKKWSQDIKKAMESGAADYIVKPFDPHVLLRKIEGVFKDGKKTADR